MKFQTKRKHMIDFIFPVALFFVFALSTITVLLLAARIYQATTENSALNYTAGTSLSYISEKIHQNDVAGGIRIDEADGTPVLVMEQDFEGSSYYTYIYALDNQLMELFVKEDADVDLSSGSRILEIRDFTMEETEDGIFSFTCTDKNGQKSSVNVSMKSK